MTEVSGGGGGVKDDVSRRKGKGGVKNAGRGCQGQFLSEKRGRGKTQKVVFKNERVV